MRSGTKLVLLGTVCAIACAFSAGSAAAATFCVGLSPCLGGTDKPGIQAAFDTAGTNGEDDTILIGPLGSPYVGDFQYSYNSATVSVIGVGAVKPVIQALPAGTYGMRLNSTGSARVENLSFVTPNVAGGTGLAWSGTAENVAVTHTGTGQEIHPLFPYGDAVFERSSLKAEGGGFGNAASLQLADSFILRDSTMESTTRVGLNTTHAVPLVILQRSSITSRGTALEVAGAGADVVAQQVLLKSTALGGTGDVVSLLNGTHFDATHATIIGNGEGRGVTVSGTTISSQATVTNSVIANVEFSGITSGGASSVGALLYTHSIVPAAPLAYSGGSSTMGAGAVIGVPVFADAAAGNYHLKAPQPSIDSGDISDATTLDLDGKPRIVNGRSDLGAYEYQRSAPVAAITVPNVIRRAQAATFSAAASTDADPGDTLAYTWTFSDGTTGTGSSVAHTFATEGAKTVTLTATDQIGVAGSATAQITVPGGPKFTIGKPRANKAGTKVSYKLGCPKVERTCTITAAITKSTKKKSPAYAKKAKVVVKGGSTKTITLKLNRAALKLIKSKHKLKTKVTFVGTDAEGNSRTVVQSYTAKAGKTGSTKDQR
jgi:hypothetical protein